MQTSLGSQKYDSTYFNQYKSIQVTPTSDFIGAEVVCARFPHVDAQAVEEIRRAWHDHLVLLFRGRVLSDDELMLVGRYFGELEQSPPTAVSQDAVRPNPFISIISNILENGKAIGSLGNDEAIWHTDMSNRPVPPAASILTSHEVPSGPGGETGFINMYRALETLPDQLRAQIQDKTIYHDGGRNSAGVKRRHSVSTSHPIIRTHPQTGVNALYLGRRRDSKVDGLASDESDALLDALWAHAEAQPAWHHQWKVGDTLVWDNRCVIHHRNGFDANARRLMHRTQTIGAVPELLELGGAQSHPRGTSCQ
jgi:taurine dioxygenase